MAVYLFSFSVLLCIAAGVGRPVQQISQPTDDCVEVQTAEELYQGIASVQVGEEVYLCIAPTAANDLDLRSLEGRVVVPQDSRVTVACAETRNTLTLHTLTDPPLISANAILAFYYCDVLSWEDTAAAQKDEAEAIHMFGDEDGAVLVAYQSTLLANKNMLVFMENPALGAIISSFQPWASVWMSQPERVSPDTWAFNLGFGNFSQSTPRPPLGNVPPPIPVRFELYNTTFWCAESFSAATPLIDQAVANSFTAAPLHTIGPRPAPQNLTDHLPVIHKSADKGSDVTGEWWFHLLIAVASLMLIAIVGAIILLNQYLANAKRESGQQCSYRSLKDRADMLPSSPVSRFGSAVTMDAHEEASNDSIPQRFHLSVNQAYISSHSRFSKTTGTVESTSRDNSRILHGREASTSSGGSAVKAGHAVDGLADVRAEVEAAVQQLQGELQGELKEDDITLYDMVGRGGYGTVYHGRWQSRDVAIKTVVFEGSKDGKQITRIAGEAAIARNLEHTNIVSTYKHDVQTISSSYGPQLGVYKLLLIQEYCNGGSLREVIGNGVFGPALKPRWRPIISVLKDIACGMEHIHKQRICHGDLNPNNVLFRVRILQ